MPYPTPDEVDSPLYDASAAAPGSPHGARR